jgi:2-dehydro-3-deoxyphosphogluconate aldolase/(4S)-4-hydroxy-2-oxoglutarate aldolase
VSSSETIDARLRRAPVVPLIQADDTAVAVQTSRALVAGGLTVIEVVLRTPAAIQCLKVIAREVPEAIVGAGTVLSEDQVEAVLLAGAKFIVSPGLYAPVVRVAQSAELPVFPGVATASEVQSAWNMGLRTVKFFPASLAGGIPMLKALGSVFGGMSFMPTGGVSAENLADFLALPSVLACGGSWLTPKSAITEGNYSAITQLALEAIAIAQKVRG